MYAKGFTSFWIISIMPIKNIKFRILRYKPGHIDPPRFQNYSVAADPALSVLDCLEKIRFEQDNSLMYRHSCHHSSCGTCACKINGKERLTCITKIRDLESTPVTLTPLDGFKPLGDLVVDMVPFYENFNDDWSYLKKCGSRPEELSHFSRFENCIECGACISACPITHHNKDFLGPAVLAAVNNELKKSPQKKQRLLSLAGSNHGEHLCERSLNCSRVCPTQVYPARQIADLRRLLTKRK
jgi:succinate dehydrogenase / fumarate reductase iron-sulfur subunit